MKSIYVLVKDSDTQKFLKSFFRGKKDMGVKYFRGVKSLSSALIKEMPQGLIIESPECLDELAPQSGEYPIIALVPANLTKGLRSVIKYNIEFYMLAPFHKEDLNYKLKILCDKKYWFENLYKEKKDLEAIIDLTYLVSSTLDPSEVLYFVVRKLSELIKVTRCSILSIGMGNPDRAMVVSSYENPGIVDIELDLKKYPEIRKALRTKKPVVVKDAVKDPLMRSVRHIIEPKKIKSIVVLPVIFRDEVIGTLFLRTSSAGHVFTEREIKLCNTIAYASSNALYNAFLYDRVRKEKAKLENLAITDYLTGVYNIRYLYLRLEEEFSRTQRYKNPLSCIMFDLDHFKKINDIYGHRTGDIVLREFAQMVSQNIRKSDVFARYGGEEFILLLPQTPIKGAKIEAERLAKLIGTHEFSSLDKGTKVTASMGVAVCPNKKIVTQDDLITFADNALFEAKNKGRNQIVVSK